MRCGVNRKSQNTNVLLVHSELGTSKRVTFELPSSKVRKMELTDFTYIIIVAALETCKETREGEKLTKENHHLSRMSLFLVVSVCYCS